MPTDTSERGLGRLICTALASHPCEPPPPGTGAGPPADSGGVGWSGGNFHDSDREYCVDLVQLSAFLRTTQPKAAASRGLSETVPHAENSWARFQGEITKHGSIDVLHHGIDHGPHHLPLFYGTPPAGNQKAQHFHNVRLVRQPLEWSPIGCLLSNDDLFRMILNRGPESTAQRRPTSTPLRRLSQRPIHK